MIYTVCRSSATRTPTSPARSPHCHPRRSVPRCSSDRTRRRSTTSRSVAAAVRHRLRPTSTPRCSVDLPRGPSPYSASASDRSRSRSVQFLYNKHQSSQVISEQGQIQKIVTGGAHWKTKTSKRDAGREFTPFPADPTRGFW